MLRRKPRIDKKQRREDILASAAAVFHERGLRGATMDDVAARMNITKVVVYRQFSSKDALIAAVFGEVIAALSSVRERPWGGYADGTIATIDAARKKPAAFLLLYRDCRGDPAYGVHFEHLRQLYVEWLLRFFPIAPRRDPRVNARLEMAAKNMTGFLLEALANWLADGDPREDHRWADWVGKLLRSWKHQTDAAFLATA